MAQEFVLKDKYNIDDLIAIIKVLRAPGGCPWDREQTHESIKKNFIEETYEVVEAINKNSADMLREELGDIVQKLVVRHPHVFGDVVANDTAEALNSWDAAKLKSKGQKSQTESMLSVPREFPALMRAQKIQHKAAKIGFDWDNVSGAVDKLYEEIDELKTAMDQGKKADIEEEFGDVLFSCVNIARFIDVDSEEALTAASDKFMSRFSLVEQMANKQGIDMKNSSIQELDMLWDKAKKIKNAE